MKCTPVPQRTHPINRAWLAWLFLTLCLGSAPRCAGGVGLAVSPATITNDYVGKVTLTISGLSPGQTVRVERFSDANGNGVINAPIDQLFRSFTVTDGELPIISGVRNLNMPGDEDAAVDGQIRVELNVPGIDNVLDWQEGNAIFRVSDPTGAFPAVAQNFRLLQKNLPQGIRGRVTIAGNGAPLPGALVVLLDAAGLSIGGTLADGNGNYTLMTPTGSFFAVPVRAGFISNQERGRVTVTANKFVTNNQALEAGTITISGQVFDPQSGAGIPGVFVKADSTNDLITLSSATDQSGRYSLQVSANQWEVNPVGGTMAELGYVRMEDRNITITNTGLDDVDFPSPKATALIYGSVKDPLNNPIIGAEIYAEYDSNLWEADARSRPPNGNYTLGVIEGNWDLDLEVTSLPPGYLSLFAPGITVVEGEAVPFDLQVAVVNAHLRGRVVNASGVGQAGLQVQAHSFSGATSAEVLTGADGSFDVGVNGDTWTLDLDEDDGLWVAPSFSFTVPGGGSVNNINFVVRTPTARITGIITNSLGFPIQNLGVYTYTAINGLEYYQYGETDDQGRFSIGVINGTWQVGLDCGTLAIRGYECNNDQSVTVSGGNRVANFFAVQIDPDNTPPSLSFSTPNNGATLVRANSISFTFSEPMHPSYSMSWSPNVSANDFSVEWSPDLRTLTRTYKTNLPAGATITWVLNPSGFSTGFRDQVGHPLPANISGNFTTAPEARPPVITFQPRGVVANVGASANFGVSATGDPPLSYQWRKNGAPLSGATSSTLSLNNLQASDSGTYEVIVENFSGAVVSSPARLGVTIPQVAPGDNFANRVAISGSIGLLGATNEFATREAGEPLHAGKFGNKSVWYRWLAPANGIATFQTSGSVFDTLLAIYTGTAVDNLTLVAAADDGGEPLTSLLQFNTQAGQEYSIAIDGLGGTSGEFVLSWDLEATPAALPVIVAPPQNQTAIAGESVTFGVTATGAGLTYQWYFQGDPIPGATSPSLVRINVGPADVGIYFVSVLNTDGRAVQSDPASLELGPSPSEISQDKLFDVIAAAASGPQPQTAFARHNPRPATSVSAGVLGTQVLNNFNATTEPGEPAHAGVIGGSSRWFVLTPQTNGTMSLDTLNSEIDTVLAVYTGSDFLSLQEVASDNNGAPDEMRSQLSFTAEAGTDYLVAVDGVNGVQGSIQLNWNLAAAPPNAAPAVELISPGPGANFFAPANVVLAALAEDGDGSVSRVEFFAGSTKIGEDASAPFQWTWTNASTGSYAITARVIDNQGAVETSAPVPVTVGLNTTDTVKPTVAITFPAANARVTNLVVTLRGTSRDERAVGRVDYSLNGSGFQTATGTSNWTANLNVVPGTNVVIVRSIDYGGNNSTELTRRFIYVVTSVLSLNTNQNGKVLPALHGKNLEVGKSYKVTATPGTGYIFAWWDGVEGTNRFNPVANFLMQSNLALVANFVPNPFLSLKGSYQGLFLDEAMPEVIYPQAGFISLALADKGAFTGKLLLAGATHSFRGQFNYLGQGSVRIARGTNTALTVNLTLDTNAPSTGSESITGTVSDGTWSAPLRMDRTVWSATRRPPPAFFGKYTVALPGSLSPSAPAGSGVGTVSIDANGNLLLAGSLADGTVVSQRGPVSKTGAWPLFFKLPSNKGLVIGWVQVTNDANPTLLGNLAWRKRALATERFYPAGFLHPFSIVGSRYTPPPAVPLLALTNGMVEISGGNLSTTLSNQVQLIANKFTVTGGDSNRLALTVVGSSGSVSGTFVHPGTRRSTPFKAVVLQQPNRVEGYFLGTNQSGSIRVF